MTLFACSDTDSNTPIGNPAGLLVFHTDANYTSSVISIVDPANQRVVLDPCFSSASTTSQLSNPLSSDLAMPSQPLVTEKAIFLDRKYASVIWVNPSLCQVVLQEPVSPGWKSNPHDAVLSKGSQLYVTRYETNNDPTPDLEDCDEGGDLFIIDYQTVTNPKRRIDLTPYALPTLDGRPTDPRPDRMIILDNLLYVTLNNITRTFDGAGPARIVVIDLATEQVQSTIELPTLKNCSVLTQAKSNPKIFATACNGWFKDADQIDSSGIAWIDTTPAVPTVTITPAALFGAPVSNSDLIVLDPHHAFALVPGSFTSTRTDGLWSFDLSGNQPRMIHTSTGSYELGGLAYHAASKTLFLGDANAMNPGLVLLNLQQPDAPVLGAKIVSDPAVGLLPRAMAFY
jgi:hypothetical protein